MALRGRALPSVACLLGVALVVDGCGSSFGGELTIPAGLVTPRAQMVASAPARLDRLDIPITRGPAVVTDTELWSVVKPQPADTALTLLVWDGLPGGPCPGAGQAIVVDQSDDIEIEITMVAGPESGACAGVGRTTVLDVPLDGPIDHRPVFVVRKVYD